jgi:hypothetical protein
MSRRLPLFVVSPDDEWKLRGLCRQPDLDPDTFFPPGSGEMAARAAKKICFHCPVVSRCRDWALTHDEFGVWGGMTERERKRLRHQARHNRRRRCG